MGPEEQEFLSNIYHEKFNFLYNLSRKLLQLKGISGEQCSDLAEELVQDAFKTASRRIDTLMAHPNPVGFLVLVVKKTSMQYCRQIEADRRRLLLMDTLVALDTPPDPINEVDPSSDLEYGVSLEMVRKALSEEDFRLFEMVALRHMTHLAASKELGISVSTSQKRLQRIREKLQKLFSP